MFRWRRRGGQEDTRPEPGNGDYPAAGDELLADDELAADDELLADKEPAEGDEPGFSAVGVAEPAGGAGWAEEDLAEDEYLAEDEDLADEEDLAEDEDLAGEEALSGEGRRRRSERADLGDPQTWTRLRDAPAVSPAVTRSDGPWDSGSDYPEVERFDFGSVLVPMRDGYDVQVFVSEEQGISIAVVNGDSGLQLQPFAAPRSSGLWHEVLPEIADEVARAGGQSRQQDGPFGPELVARVVPQGAEGAGIPPQPLRFIGADGPRWFLRGLISGPAAMDEELARPLEEIFADVVVVRGDHAEPPRKPLDIRLPDEARQVLESQLAAQEGTVLNPFERGPEITETR